MKIQKFFRTLLFLLILSGIPLAAMPSPAGQAYGAFPTISFPTKIKLPDTVSTAVPILTSIPLATLVPSCDHWKVEIDLPSSASEIGQLGGIKEGLSKLESQINPGLFGLPIKSKITSTSSANGGAVYSISIEGYGVEMFKQVLFKNLAPVVDIFNLPISMALSGNAKAGQSLELLLSDVPSLGQKWTLGGLQDIVKIVSSKIECLSHVAPGSPLTQTLLLEFLKDGFLNLDLHYGRVWENLAKAPVRITLELCSFPEFFNLVNNNHKKLSAVPPPAPSVNLGGGDSASSYDWSTSNNRTGASQVTGVRDQGSCGSCWAFATVGVLESAIKTQGGGDQDLSEQYLVSCNSSGWSCDGGLWAHDYHINKNGNLSNPPGAVLESAFPYTASNAACRLFDKHPYLAQSWQYVGDESLESVSSIKAAIQQYGPVAASVCASDAFLSYTGGVYDINECGNVNHAIIIVGWDDASESWKIRNSWGSGWGEGGYMRIKWGVNAVVRDANAVVFGGGGGVPSPTAVNTPTAAPTNIPSATPAAQATQTSAPAQPTQTAAPAQATQTTAPGQPTQTAAPAQATQTTAPGQPTQTAAPAQATQTPVPGQATQIVPPGQATQAPAPGQATQTFAPGQATQTFAPGQETQPPAPIQATQTVPPPLQPGTYDDTDPHLIYSGEWYLFNGSGPANDTVHYSNAIGNGFSFTFQGSSFRIGFTGHPSRGVMLATIDGISIMLFNQFNWTLEWQREWVSPIISPGFHAVTIQHGMGLQADLDYITISP